MIGIGVELSTLVDVEASYSAHRFQGDALRN
jgi:hypothetical protein